MGLVVIRDGAPYVLEASATVRYTPLKKWIERGAGHHCELKRLRDSATMLTPEHVNALHQAGARFLGRPYDLTFGRSSQDAGAVWERCAVGCAGHFAGGNGAIAIIGNGGGAIAPPRCVN
jgi:hypothetical protein